MRIRPPLVLAALLGLTALLMGPAWALTLEEAVTVIIRAYEELLLREPDPGGLESWTQYLLDGHSVTEFRQQIISSAEYQQRHAAPPPAQGILPVAALPGLRGDVVFNTGPFLCDGTAREFQVINAGPVTMSVWNAREWHGVDFGRFADFHSQTNRLSDGALLSLFQQDRYSNPGGVTHSDVAFTRAFLIRPGDGLRLGTQCAEIGTSGGHGHTTVQIWWTPGE